MRKGREKKVLRAKAGSEKEPADDDDINRKWKENREKSPLHFISYNLLPLILINLWRTWALNNFKFGSFNGEILKFGYLLEASLLEASNWIY